MKPLVELYRGATSVYWELAFVKHNIPILNQREAIVIPTPPNANWFADPFIWEVRKEEIDIIAEEFDVKEKKGIITLVTVSRTNNSIIRKRNVLELDTHLSFPFIYREGGKTYIFPENSASGVHKVYEVDNNCKAQELGIVVNDPLVDTAVIKIGDVYYLFGTKVPEENGSVLRVYKSDTLTGTYSFHQTIEVNYNTARGASGIYGFEEPNVFYRLSQDNEGFYGRGMVFQKIVFDPSNSYFSIQEEYRKYPCFEDKKIVAMHTYNSMDGIAVIDVKKYKHTYLGRFINYIRYRK